jgi:hypothetical protein
MVVSRAVDVVSVLLLVLAVVAFAFGLVALGDRKDLEALYFLVVGALCLRSSTEMFRPRSGSRS